MQVHGVRTRRAQPPPNPFFQVYDEDSTNPSFSIQYYPGLTEGDLRALVVIISAIRPSFTVSAKYKYNIASYTEDTCSNHFSKTL